MGMGYAGQASRIGYFFSGRFDQHRPAGRESNRPAWYGFKAHGPYGEHGQPFDQRRPTHILMLERPNQ